MVAIEFPSEKHHGKCSRVEHEKHRIYLGEHKREQKHVDHNKEYLVAHYLMMLFI